MIYNTVGVVNTTNTKDAARTVINRLKPFHVKVYREIDKIYFTDNVNITITDNLNTIIDLTSNQYQRFLELENSKILLNQDMNFIHSIFNYNYLRIPAVQAPGSTPNSFILNSNSCIVDYNKSEIYFNVNFNMSIKLRLSVTDNNGNIERYYLLDGVDYEILTRNRNIAKIFRKETFDLIIALFDQSYEVTIDYLNILSDKFSISISNDYENDNWLPVYFDLDEITASSSFNNAGNNKTIYKIRTTNTDTTRRNWLSEQYTSYYDVSFAFTNSEALYNVEPYSYNMYSSTNTVIDGNEYTMIDQNPTADALLVSEMPNSEVFNYYNPNFGYNYEFNDLYINSLNFPSADYTYKPYDISGNFQLSNNIYGTPSTNTILTKFISADIGFNFNNSVYNLTSTPGAKANNNNYKEYNQYHYSTLVRNNNYELGIGLDLLNDSNMMNYTLSLTINPNNTFTLKCLDTNEVYIKNQPIAKINGKMLLSVRGSTSYDIVHEMDYINIPFSNNINIIDRNIVSTANDAYVRTKNLKIKKQIGKFQPNVVYQPIVLDINEDSKIDSVILTSPNVINSGDILLLEVDGILSRYVIGDLNAISADNKTIDVKTFYPSLIKVPTWAAVDNIKLKSSLSKTTTANIYTENSLLFKRLGNTITATGDFTEGQGKNIIMEVYNINIDTSISEINADIGNTNYVIADTPDYYIPDVCNFFVSTDNAELFAGTYDFNIAYNYSYTDTSYVANQYIDYFNQSQDTFGKNTSMITNIFKEQKTKYLDYAENSIERFGKNIPIEDKYGSFYITYINNNLFSVSSANRHYSQLYTGQYYSDQVPNPPFNIFINSAANLKTGEQFVMNTITSTQVNTAIESEAGYSFNILPNIDYIVSKGIVSYVFNVDALLQITDIGFIDISGSYTLVNKDLPITEIMTSDIGYIRVEKLNSSTSTNTEIIYTIYNYLSNPTYVNNSNNVLNDFKMCFNYFNCDLPKYKQNAYTLNYNYNEDIYITTTEQTGDERLFTISVKSYESNIDFTQQDCSLDQPILIKKNINGLDYAVFTVSFFTNYNDTSLTDQFTLVTKSKDFTITTNPTLNIKHAFAITQSDAIGYLNRNNLVATIYKNLDLYNGGEFYTLEVTPSTKFDAIVSTSNANSPNNVNYVMSVNQGKLFVQNRNSTTLDISKTGINESLVVYYEDDKDNRIEYNYGFDIETQLSNELFQKMNNIN